MEITIDSLRQSFDIKTAFDKNKLILLESFIKHYGEQHRDEITNTFKNIKLEVNNNNVYSYYNHLLFLKNYVDSIPVELNNNDINKFSINLNKEIDKEYFRVSEFLKEYLKTLSTLNIEYIYRALHNKLTNKERNLVGRAIRANEHDSIDVTKLSGYNKLFGKDLLFTASNISDYANEIKNIYLQRATIEAAYKHPEFGVKLDLEGYNSSSHTTEFVYEKANDFINPDINMRNHVDIDGNKRVISMQTQVEGDYTHELIRLINSALIYCGDDKTLNTLNDVSANIICDDLYNSNIEIIENPIAKDSPKFYHSDEEEYINKLFRSNILSMNMLNGTNKFYHHQIQLVVDSLSESDLYKLKSVLLNLPDNKQVSYNLISSIVDSQILKLSVNNHLTNNNIIEPINSYHFENIKK